MNVGFRVKELRNYLDLTQTAFADKLGLKYTAIGLIENGVRNLTQRNFDLICEKFSVNPDWLRTGEGSMFIESDSSLISQLAKEYNLNTAAQMLLTTFLGLESGTRDAIIKFMQDFASQLAANNVSGSSVVSPQPNFNDLYTNPLINQHRCIPSASDKAIPDEKNA